MKNATSHRDHVKGKIAAADKARYTHMHYTLHIHIYTYTSSHAHRAKKSAGVQVAWADQRGREDLDEAGWAAVRAGSDTQCKS